MFAIESLSIEIERFFWIFIGVFLFTTIFKAIWDSSRNQNNYMEKRLKEIANSVSKEND